MTVPSFPPVAEQLEILRRGAVDLVDETQLAAKLEASREQGRPLTVKTGFDATAPDLHLGHTVLLEKMRQFQDLGHRVIFLIGDFTGMIGDPTGKKATRPQLTREEIEANQATYERQVFNVLDREATEIDYNGRWLAELGTEGVVRLAGSITLAQMMARDDLRSRWEQQQPISIHELLYPLFQAYDSVFLEADVELGGHDQIFNLLIGRDLMREKGLEPQVVLTVPLLVGIDGEEKMSKSLGNAIGVEDPPKEIYGRTMSIPDDLMWDWLLLLTDVAETEIAKRRKEVEGGELNPKKTKQGLARLLVERYHGAEAATEAEREFDSVFARGGVPDDIQDFTLSSPSTLLEILSETKLAPSNREARRLLQQGAVSIDGERRSDGHDQLPARDEPYVLKVGKRRFARVRITA